VTPLKPLPLACAVCTHGAYGVETLRAALHTLANCDRGRQLPDAAQAARDTLAKISPLDLQALLLLHGWERRLLDGESEVAWWGRAHKQIDVPFDARRNGARSVPWWTTVHGTIVELAGAEGQHPAEALAHLLHLHATRHVVFVSETVLRVARENREVRTFHFLSAQPAHRAEVDAAHARYCLGDHVRCADHEWVDIAPRYAVGDTVWLATRDDPHAMQVAVTVTDAKLVQAAGWGWELMVQKPLSEKIDPTPP